MSLVTLPARSTNEQIVRNENTPHPSHKIICQAFQPGATAASQIFVMHNNSGGEQISFHELAEDWPRSRFPSFAPRRTGMRSALWKISRSTQSIGHGSL